MARISHDWLVPKIKRHGVENTGKTLQTGKSMENLFQLLSKKEETLPSDAVKLLSWRRRIKKLTWVGENSVVPRYAKQERDERSIPTHL